MGKAQKKTGKGRLDKYYKLAKEQGYRARSAFKLIQLNKKYGFLESARCCIDLCAAPGGWLQVASKYMPASSVIVGVDLVPIKPIPRVVTFAADITAPQCRNLIRNELKDWRADVVLHDGAPNVGTAWVQDAYSQSELVLMSLKLAVEFLIKGGTFVTKVFRSVDYNSLLWVFGQLFGKVEATKPPSSRNVSAEIFVVCRDFLAPKHIDPKFLDPKHVFKEVTASAPTTIDKGASINNVSANVFQPDKKRRNRDGYTDGDYTLFKKVPALEFINTPDPISLLGSVNKIAFETEEEKNWRSNELTTDDIKANCDDLKVLGKGDFKALLKWRTALREELGLELKSKPTEELTEAVEIAEIDEDEQIQTELERLHAEAAARTKRERRRANEIRTRTLQRMQLQMTAPLDIGMEQNDAALGLGQDDVFDLEETENAGRRSQRGRRVIWEGEEMDVIDDSEESNDEAGSGEDGEWEDEQERKTTAMEAELDGLYDSYRERLRERDAKFKVKEAREKNKEREEWSGIRARDEDSDEGSDGDSEEGGWEKTQAKREVDTEESSAESSEDEQEVTGQKRGRLEKEPVPKSKRVRLVAKLQEPASTSRAAQLWFSQDFFKDVGNISDIEEDEVEEEPEEVDAPEPVDIQEEDNFEVVPREQEDDEDVKMWDADDDDERDIKAIEAKKYALLTPEAVTLAQQLVNRQTTRTELINSGFTRYSLNSKEDLPSWFLDEEAKYYKPNIPVTKEAIAALRARQRVLDARPIKKVAEAKARKKMKALARLEKAVKKAEGVNSSTDMTEKEKAQQIEKLMKRGEAKGKHKKEVKVVVAKGVHKGLKGRPKGVKGRYVMVDSRMKKELKAKKRKEKANKKRKRA